MTGAIGAGGSLWALSPTGQAPRRLASELDPASRIAVTGQNIVLTTNTAATFSTPAGSGWLATGTAPPLSNFYTNYFTGSTASASLVTSTVILDDVGRGSTGGDLVIGGLSTGATSIATASPAILFAALCAAFALSACGDSTPAARDE